MAEPLRHRQTKEAATDMFSLQPPRHISTLHIAVIGERSTLEDCVRKNTGQKNQKCKNCEGKGTLKKGDKIVRCRRCGGTGIKP